MLNMTTLLQRESAANAPSQSGAHLSAYRQHSLLPSLESAWWEGSANKAAMEMVIDARVGGLTTLLTSGCFLFDASMYLRKRTQNETGGKTGN